MSGGTKYVACSVQYERKYIGGTGDAWYVFNASSIVSVNPEDAIAAVCKVYIPSLEGLCQDAENALLRNINVREEIYKCIKEKVPFLPVIDVSAFPQILVSLNKNTTPAADDELGRQCTIAYETNTALDASNPSLNNLKYVVFNQNKGYYNTNLKLIE